MVKINANPVQPIITIKPTVDMPDYDAWERLPKIAWRDLVARTRRTVSSALNQFYYGEQ